MKAPSILSLVVLTIARTMKVVKLQCTGFRIDRRIGVIVPAFVRITLFVGQSQIQRDLDFLVTQVLRIESFGLGIFANHFQDA